MCDGYHCCYVTTDRFAFLVYIVTNHCYRHFFVMCNEIIAELFCYAHLAHSSSTNIVSDMICHEQDGVQCIYDVIGAFFLCMVNKRRTWSIAGVALGKSEMMFWTTCENISDSDVGTFTLPLIPIFQIKYLWYQIKDMYSSVIIHFNDIWRCWRPLQCHLILTKWLVTLRLDAHGLVTL